MDIKINPVQRPAAAGKYQGVVKTATASAASGIRQDADRVDLSESTRMFNAMLQSAKGMPEVRNDLVDTMKQRIDSGAYKPDSRAIADKMLAYITRK